MDGTFVSRYYHAVQSFSSLESPMQLLSRFYFVCVVILLATAPGQVKSGTGVTFRDENLGLSYTIPAKLVPSPEHELPQDPTGRERVILALWDNPRRTPIPRIVFLWDTKVGPSTLSPDQIAEEYLRSLKPGEGYKMGQPIKASVGGNTVWRMDYWRPDDSGQSFNAAIVVPLKDRAILFVQMNASSQRGLDLLVDSLHGLRFDQKLNLKNSAKLPRFPVHG